MAKTPKNKPATVKAVRSASRKPAAKPHPGPTKIKTPAKTQPRATAEPAKPPVSKVKPTPGTAENKSVKKARTVVAEKPVNHAPPVIIPAPMPTDGKPRKNQAGLSAKELEFYRGLLLAKRRELVGDMSSMEREALRSTTGTNLSNLPLHMADMGTDNYEQEFTLGLVEKDRQLLREINRALAKIQDGTYGICEGTGKPISKPRLEAQPWAKFSIEYARQLERNGGILRR